MSTIPSPDEAWAKLAIVKLVQRLGGLDEERLDQLLESTQVAFQDDRIEIRFDYLGETAWYDWDGSRQSLDGIVAAAARGIATTIESERKAYGRTPWDA
jgi:hypothetical protein